MPNFCESYPNDALWKGWTLLMYNLILPGTSFWPRRLVQSSLQATMQFNCKYKYTLDFYPCDHWSCVLLIVSECGAKNKLLTRKQLKENFPWLNTDDIELGCLGMENEGWLSTKFHFNMDLICFSSQVWSLVPFECSAKQIHFTWSKICSGRGNWFWLQGAARHIRFGWHFWRAVQKNW